MCGIHLEVHTASSETTDCACHGTPFQKNANVDRRGPDVSHVVEISCQASSSSHQVFLQASVLQMRRDLIQQPVDLGDDSHLCWNGEVYQMLDDENQVQDMWQYDRSDTEIVTNLVAKALQEAESDDPLPKLVQIMSRFINAEYAVVIVTRKALYYCRDHWGRRSLLHWECPTCGSFQICSVVGESSSPTTEQDRQAWVEIPPGKMMEYRFDTGTRRSIDLATPSFDSPPLKTLLPIPSPPDGVSDGIWKASFYLQEYLTQAVAMRIDHSDDARPTAVLFSGGIDSVVLAALAIQCSTRPVVLSNVSFGDHYEKSADRQAALISFQALQELFPNKTIQYEDIVLDWEDIVANEPHIRTILTPKTTLMDVNIATALWFASRGMDKDKDDDLTKKPRVLLLGMGADEQMGGYGRHRKAYDQRGGWQALKEELQMDQSRLWERNLGRDDRIGADHGKEARFPYLDAHVSRLLCEQLPLEQVCDFSLPPGEGDKRVLRLVAIRLGLEHASGLVKRAIQFGSRISHLSDTKRFGSRRKAKGQAEAPSTNEKF
jgi:asparagine synthetase B (glutamine-hydrolysing)